MESSLPKPKLIASSFLHQLLLSGGAKKDELGKFPMSHKDATT